MPLNGRNQKRMAIRVKYHPDITKEEKAEFEEIVKGLYMTDKRKKKVFKLITKNQKRNENSNATSTGKD